MDFGVGKQGMHTLPQNEKRKLKNKFNEIDKDFSGSVSLLEMGRYFDGKGVHVSESALKTAFQEISNGAKLGGELNMPFLWYFILPAHAARLIHLFVYYRDQL